MHATTTLEEPTTPWYATVPLRGSLCLSRSSDEPNAKSGGKLDRDDGQALDLLEVGVRARDDLAGAQRVLPRAVEPRDRAEHPASQVVLHRQREPAPEVAAQERHRELHQRERDDPRDDRLEPRRGPAHRPVDRHGHEQRPDRLQPHPERRGADGGDREATVAPAVEPEAADRLSVFTRTDDGFEIAREDLRIRGMGDLFGERQSGVPTFRVADPLRDELLNEQARAAADRLLAVDPGLDAPANAPLRRVLGERYARSLELFRVG